MLNFVIREIWLKLCVTREFCYNLCMKRDHDPPPLPPSFATLEYRIEKYMTPLASCYCQFFVFM